MSSIIERLGLPSLSSTSDDTTSSSQTGAGEGVAIDTDTALSLLANKRRRLIIRYAIEETDGVFDLVEVVRYITTHQYGDDYTGSERKAVYVSLYQVHIPDLVDTGALEDIDSGRGHTFRVDEAMRPLYDVLDTTTDRLGGGA